MKTKNYIYASAILFTLTLATTSLSADTLAQWNFSTDLTATTEAADISGSTVTLGSFSSASTSYYGRSSGGQDLYSRAFELTATNGDGRILGTTEAVSVDTRNTYFEFTLTPTADAFDLTSFTANIKAQIASDPNNSLPGFTAYFLLRSDADNYATNLGTGNVSVNGVIANQGLTSAPTVFSADLSAFNNISSAVTFRLYTYAVGEGDVALASNHIVRADDFTITGSAIPEPSQTAAALGVISLLSIALIRRRAKR